MVSGKQPQKLLLLLQTGGHHIRTLLNATGTIHCRHRHTDTHAHLHTLGFCSTEKASYQPAKRDRMLKSVTLPHLRRPCSKISVMCGERQRRTALEAFSSSDGSGTLVCSEYKRGGGGKGTKRSPSHPSCHTPYVTPLMSHPSRHTLHITPFMSHPSRHTPHIPPLTSHPSCHTPHVHPSHHTPHITPLTSHPSQHTVRYTLTSPHRDQRILTHLTFPHTSPHTPLTHHHVPLHKPSSSQPWCP